MEPAIDSYLNNQEPSLAIDITEKSRLSDNHPFA